MTTRIKITKEMQMHNSTTIIVTGATGNLGGRIVNSILKQGAGVRAFVRTGTGRDKSEALRRSGASVVEVDFHQFEQVVEACAGASCINRNSSELGSQRRTSSGSRRLRPGSEKQWSKHTARWQALRKSVLGPEHDLRAPFSADHLTKA